MAGRRVNKGLGSASSPEENQLMSEGIGNQGQTGRLNCMEQSSKGFNTAISGTAFQDGQVNVCDGVDFRLGDVAHVPCIE